MQEFFQKSTFWITKSPKDTRRQSKIMEWLGDCYLQGCTSEMWQKKRTETFKGNFKTIMCGVAKDFPMNLWDCLIPQAELTCNILHQSNVAPKVAAQAYAFGPHDSNRMPLAPMVCAVQIHEKTSKSKTWGVHSVDGWYLQTHPHHYRCFEVWSKHTGTERISDIVFLTTNT